MIRRLATAGAVFTVVYGCATNPYTRRSQLMLVSLSEEAAFGNRAYQAVLKNASNHPLSSDPAQVDVVQRVAERIIAAAKRSQCAETAAHFDWQVTVFDAPDIQNAFALPGGKIVVFSGIFPVARNEAGLAAILGHEVVHALARHSAERMSQGMVEEVGLLAADFGLQMVGLGKFASQAVAGVLGIGVQVGVLLPYSRAHESEADYIGLLLAAQAGYDPREAVRLWERIELLAPDAQPPPYLSTHPGHGTRIAQMNTWMPEALALYQPATDAPPADLPGLGTQPESLIRRATDAHR